MVLDYRCLLLNICVFTVRFIPRGRWFHFSHFAKSLSLTFFLLTFAQNLIVVARVNHLYFYIHRGDRTLVVGTKPNPTSVALSAVS